MASRYGIIEGKFFCGTCENTASTARLYYDSKKLSWLCIEKHLTEVMLQPEKKSKKDYEREK